MCEDFLSPADLSDLVLYLPENGELLWRHRETSQFSATQKRTAVHQRNLWNSRHANKAAFTDTTKKGYRRGSILGRKVMAHRVAWAIYWKEWPTNEIDHINGNRSDNRICNLRAATRFGNCRNRISCGNASSRYLGVSWNTKMQRWRAQISVNGKNLHLGYFQNECEAALAYDTAAIRHFKEYANPNFGGSKDA